MFWHCIVVVRGRINVPSAVIIVHGVVVVIYVRWHLAGVALATFPLRAGVPPALRRRRRPPHAGTIAPSCWCHRPSRAGFCPLTMPLAIHCHRRAGIFAASIALALSPLLCWRCHTCRTGVFALHWHHRQHPAGVCPLVQAFSSSCAGLCPFAMLRHVVVAELASLPALCWCPREHCVGVGWRHRKHRAGVFALGALASSTQARRRLSNCNAAREEDKLGSPMTSALSFSLPRRHVRNELEAPADCPARLWGSCS